MVDELVREWETDTALFTELLFGENWTDSVRARLGTDDLQDLGQGLAGWEARFEDAEGRPIAFPVKLIVRSHFDLTRVERENERSAE